MKKPAVMLVVWICFAAFPAMSPATEAVYEQRMARGVGAIESGDYKAAESEFRSAAREKPGDPNATLYLGVALSRGGKDEAETVLKEALRLDPGNPRTPFELGFHYYMRDRYDAAAEYFEKAARMAPGTEVSRNAESFLTAMKEKGAKKRWSLNLSGGLQYDSNIIVSPDDRPLPAGISERSDVRAVFLLKGRYMIFSGNKGDLSAGYSLYQSYHQNLEEFNINQSVPDLKASYNLAPWLTFRGMYSHESTNLGGGQYSYAHTINPSIVIREGERYSTVFDYRWKKTQYRNGTFFLTNSDRTGRDIAYVITQNASLHKAVQGRAGFAYDEDRTRRNFWDYNGYRTFAGLTFLLPRKSFLDISADIYRRKYNAEYPGFGVFRRDTTRTYSANAGYPLSSRYTLIAGHTYTEAASNVADFTYRRNVTGLFLNARF